MINIYLTLLRDRLSEPIVVRQFVKFSFIGIANTGIDFFILNLLTFFTGLKEGMWYSIFKGISYGSGAIFSYFMNKRWAFRDSSKTGGMQKISRFFAVSAVGTLVNVGVASFVVNILKKIVVGTLIIYLSDQVWVNIGALSGTAIGLVWNFFGYKFVVFKK